jgi:hypothetical protein
MRDDTNDDCDELRALPPPEYSRLFLVCETVVTVLVKVLTVAAVAGDACRRIQAILVDAQRLRNSCGGGRPSQHR